MKWHIILEIRFHGDPDGVEAVLDAVMEHLVGAGIEGPSIGAALREGVAEVEFVVEASSLKEAHQQARLPGRARGGRGRDSLSSARPDAHMLILI